MVKEKPAVDACYPKHERTMFAQTLNKSFDRALARLLFSKARTGGGREALLAVRRRRRQVAAPNHRGDTASVFNCKPRWVGFKKGLIFLVFICADMVKEKPVVEACYSKNSVLCSPAFRARVTFSPPLCKGRWHAAGVPRNE